MWRRPLWIAGDINLPDIQWKTDTVSKHQYTKQIIEHILDTFSTFSAWGLLKSHCEFSWILCDILILSSCLSLVHSQLKRNILFCDLLYCLNNLKEMFCYLTTIPIKLLYFFFDMWCSVIALPDNTYYLFFKSMSICSIYVLIRLIVSVLCI